MKIFEGFQKGVNVGGWISQCKHTIEHYDTFFTQKDVEILKGWGIDHLRVPVDYELIEDAQENYIEENFKYIDNVISWCEEAGLNMVLDIHRTFGYSFYEGDNENGFFQNEAYQERFYRLWEKLAGKYGKIGSRVCFELLNEVTDKSYCESWNEIADKCIDRIRAIAPDVKILVGGYWNNSVEAVSDLRAPHDENIVYNFHCYEPLIYTHQGAGWIAEMPADFRMSLDQTYRYYADISEKYFVNSAAKFLNCNNNIDDKLDHVYFEKFFEQAVSYADKYNVPLYCGEYGVIDLADPRETLKWFKAINEAFVKYGIGRAVWTYKSMNFGLEGSHYADVKDELIKYL